MTSKLNEIQMELDFAKFSDRVTCCKCNKYFKCPRRLPCSCALCNDCVPRDSAESRFSCPSCISESRNLQFGNFFLARSEHVLTTIQQHVCSERSRDLNCECCTNQCLCKVVAWCSFPDCGFMCDKGLKAHVNMTGLCRHSFFTEPQLHDLFYKLSRMQNDFNVVPEQVTRETHCYSHSREVLNFYCMDCSEILCTEGAEKHPDGHEINEYLNAVYLQLRCDENIKRQVTQAFEITGELSERQKAVESRKNLYKCDEAFRTKLDSWTAELNKTYPKLKAVIKSALNILDWMKVESAYLVLIEYKRISSNLEACIQEAGKLLSSSAEYTR